MRGDKVYEYDLDITGVTDYGVSMEAILTRQIWAAGTVNLAAGKTHIDAYMQ